MKVTNHHEEFQREIILDCSEPVLTDQSFKNDCDINIIMKNYSKTGILPQSMDMGQYIDATEIPSLEQAFDISNRAMQLFQDLPAEVRSLINHDPTRLENLLVNPDYRDILVRHGVLKLKDEDKKVEREINLGVTDTKDPL